MVTTHPVPYSTEPKVRATAGNPKAADVSNTTITDIIESVADDVDSKLSRTGNPFLGTEQEWEKIQLITELESASIVVLRFRTFGMESAKWSQYLHERAFGKDGNSGMIGDLIAGTGTIDTSFDIRADNYHTYDAARDEGQSDPPIYLSTEYGITSGSAGTQIKEPEDKYDGFFDTQ